MCCSSSVGPRAERRSALAVRSWKLLSTRGNRVGWLLVQPLFKVGQWCAKFWEK